MCGDSFLVLKALRLLYLGTHQIRSFLYSRILTLRLPDQHRGFLRSIIRSICIDDDLGQLSFMSALAFIDFLVETLSIT
jgi:hypothetical protein